VEALLFEKKCGTHGNFVEILGSLVEMLGSFVKYCSTEALVEKFVKGKNSVEMWQCCGNAGLFYGNIGFFAK